MKSFSSCATSLLSSFIVSTHLFINFLTSSLCIYYTTKISGCQYFFKIFYKKIVYERIRKTLLQIKEMAEMPTVIYKQPNNN